ncbi:MAG: low molecular weight protein-tyrosine-phosphatase [Nannocystaceae bacterium]|nr:low molecular weight phosphotyrosine protein phosphatase [bacterium]
MTTRVCFVCLGNICRSPTAEGVFRHLVAERGATDFVVQSAGTAAHHVGESPDRRATATAARRGITLQGAAARFDAEDFERFDWVIAMDRANARDLRRRAPTPADEAKVHLLRRWDPHNTAGEALDVPDPYYGDASGFDEVLDICERSCAALLQELEAARG